MPDICMCIAKKCPEKETCYRYKARASHWQTYSYLESVCNKENGYKEKIEMEEK